MHPDPAQRRSSPLPSPQRIRDLLVRAFAAFLTCCLALVALPASAGGNPTLLTLGTGERSGPYDNAIGSFSPPAANEVCALIDASVLAGFKTRFRLASWGVGVTSPAGSPVGTDQHWGLRIRLSDSGHPGAAIAEYLYGQALTPGAYPNPTYATQDVPVDADKIDPGGGFYACYGSWTPLIHFGARHAPGQSFAYTQDDGVNWQVFQDASFDWGLTLKVSAPITTRTYYSPAVADIPGVNSTFNSEYDVRYVSPNYSGFTLAGTYTPRLDQSYGTQFQDQHTFDVGRQVHFVTTFPDSADYIGSAIWKVEGTGGSGGSLAHAQALRRGDPLMMEGVITSTLADGRVFGQWFPTFTRRDDVDAGDTALFHTTHDPSRYRVNFLVMALEDGTAVSVTPVAPIGSPRATSYSVTLNQGQNFQINDVNGFFGLGGLADYMIELAVESGDAIGVGSVLDGTSANPGTSDPTTVLAAVPSNRITLLEVGAIQGINEFSGSAMIANHSSTTAQVTAEFYARGTPGVGASSSFTIPAGGIVGYDDVVGDLLGLSNTVGTLVLRTTNDTMISAVGREFAVYRDGQGHVNGTAGQLMPGLTADDLLQPGSTYEFLGVMQHQDQIGIHRTHASLFNPGDQDVTATLMLLDDIGNADGSPMQQIVRPGELVRLNNVADQINPSQDGGLKSLVVTTDGNIYALVFDVNSTGDPVTRPPFRR